MGNDMQNNVDKRGTQGRTTRARALLPLAIGACIALLAAECSKPHVQETVTVAPRAAATQAKTITVANSRAAPPAVDAETEAAGDALAHAMVALKARRRDEALHYMNLARTRLTYLVNRTTASATTNSNPTRERLINDLRELEAAERSARHNDYEQSAAQLLSISNELDHLSLSLNRPQN
jgi:hypothetical protein